MGRPSRIVIIGGTTRKRQGQLVGVDVARIARTPHESRDFIVSRAGWPLTRVGGGLPGR